MTSKRATNFTYEDVHRLTSLVAKHSKLLECKKTDKFTWAHKEAGWKKLAVEFNASTNFHRTHQALQAKYKNLKKDYRKEAAEVKLSIFKTGGGSHVEKKPSPFNGILAEILTLSTEGNSNSFDSDRATAFRPPELNLVNDMGTDVVADDLEDGIVYDAYVRQAEEDIDNPDEVIDNIEDRKENVLLKSPIMKKDWSKYTPSMLKQPLDSALKGNKRKVPESTPSGSASKSDNETLASSPKRTSSTQAKTSNSMKWTRPTLSTKKAETIASASTASYKLLADRKNDLTKTLNDVAAKDFTFREEEHIKIMEKHELEIQLLRLQIEGQRFDNLLKEAQVVAK